ncbi:MAG: aldo/keto reductase [Nocardioidaceae bacterium]
MSTLSTMKLNTGAEMPALGLGTWRLSGDACERAVEWALEIGYRHIDTAAMYRNEAAVGAGVRASGVPREDIFITTKLAGGDHRRARDAARDSVERLDLDYVDCYLIHWPAGNGADLDVWQVLEELQSDGTLRAIGVSNYSVGQLVELLDTADVPPAVNQVEMNPFVQPRDIEQTCHERGVAVQAYTPLGRAADLDNRPLVDVSHRLGRSAAQVMLRWGLQRGAAVLPKSGNRERLAANAEIFDFELSTDDMAVVDALG